ncbi:Protein of unknown function [Lactobacillus delbrueckii subsp. lactis]|nr:Protein of unknown function [Lactobacillus delbrueckii subsp. lactis]CDR84014.1 Protein of unknown function [Lactobacillus delbrueckii subsp. lactis]
MTMKHKADAKKLIQDG